MLNHLDLFITWFLLLKFVVVLPQRYFGQNVNIIKLSIYAILETDYIYIYVYIIYIYFLKNNTALFCTS